MGSLDRMSRRGSLLPQPEPISGQGKPGVGPEGTGEPPVLPGWGADELSSGAGVYLRSALAR
jgi:hypothetical protein